MLPNPNQESIHARLERERKASQPNPGLVRVFRHYALGYQRSTLNREQERILRALLGNRFCDNVAKMVLLAATGRVQLVRFDVAEPAPPAADDATEAPKGPVTTWLHQWWIKAQLPTLQGRVHWATLRDGNHAVACSWDRDKAQVRLTREPWWDGKQGLWIAYDTQDQPAYAVKEWHDPRVGWRRVLWWPDAIERYVQAGEGWRPYPLDPANPGSWRDPWLDRNGKPLGLPVVHFANAYLPADSEETDSSYGVSELDGGVLGLQDEINDIQRDITSSARLAGFMQYYATGYQAERTDDGSIKDPLTVGPGYVWYNENPEGRFGTLPPGPMAELDAALRIKLQAVSRNTSTPLHLITGGDWPSGEALMRADKPLSNKAAAICRVLGPAWASLAHKATLLATTFSNTPLNTQALITAVFAPVDDPDTLQLAEQAQAIAPYVSEEEILRKLNYGPDKITQIMAERRAAAPTPAVLAQTVPVTTSGSDPGTQTGPGLQPTTNGAQTNGR